MGCNGVLDKRASDPMGLLGFWNNEPVEQWHGTNVPGGKKMLKNE